MDTRATARRLSYVLSDMGSLTMQQEGRMKAITTRQGRLHNDKDSVWLHSLQSRTLAEIDKRLDMTYRHIERLNKWRRLIKDQVSSPPRRKSPPSRRRSRSRSPSPTRRS